MYNGLQILTWLDAHSGLILLEAAGTAVLLPELLALYIPTDPDLWEYPVLWKY
jgi:hypothetical protein